MKLHRHKQMLYEGGIHMPSYRGRSGFESRDRSGDDLVSGIDISAATLAAAGLEMFRRTWKGRDFLAAELRYAQRNISQPLGIVVTTRSRRFGQSLLRKYKYLRNYLTDRPYMQPTYKDRVGGIRKNFVRLMADGQLERNSATVLW